MGRPTTTAVRVEDLEALRRPLTAYCYRMLGAAADTDDAVQETMIRATAALDRFDPERARLTTWVHRIATNICIDMLRSARRRALATDMGPAAETADLGHPRSPDEFVEPMPDRRLFGEDPVDAIAGRETVRLAFVAALQHLPPKQRAVLVLRDVLAFSAAEVADMTGTTIASTNSALQRARSRLEEVRPDPVDVLEPDDPTQRALLDRYVAAFEAHDIATLRTLLADDAVSSMPPFAWWLQGADRIASVMAASDACASDRLLPTAICGAPGFGQYRPAPDGGHEPFALVMLEVRDGRVVHSMTFLGTADRFAEFGLPSTP